MYSSVKSTFLALLLVLPFTSFGQSILSENFETNPFNNGWTAEQAAGSDGWGWGTTSSLSSAFFGIQDSPDGTNVVAANDDRCNCNASQDYLISPSFSLAGISGEVKLLFELYFLGGSYDGDTETAFLQISTDGGATYSNLMNLQGSESWQTVMVDLDSYAGYSDVRLRFHYNDNGGWLYGAALNSVNVFIPEPYDLRLVSVDIPEFLNIGYYDLDGRVINFGTEPLTSFDVSWNRGGTVYTSTISGINIEFGETYDFTHDTKLDLAVAQDYTITVAVDKPNGQDITTLTDNEIQKNITAIDVVVSKNVVIEQHTGAWCQFCPDGSYILRNIRENHDNAITVSIHNGDAMAFADGNTVGSEFVSGYPTGTIDRFQFPGQSGVDASRTTWENRYLERLGATVPFTVSAENTYDASSRMITVDMEVTSHSSFEGEPRLNVFIVEDSVTGTGSGYNQANAYNNQSGHPYQGAGNPIVGYNHMNVARAFLGGPWGEINSLPTSIASGETFSYQFTYTIPAGYDEDQIRVVALVQNFSSDGNDREIFNAVEMSLNESAENEVFQIVLSAEEADLVNDKMQIKIYPNPTSDKVNMAFVLKEQGNLTIDIIDLLGKSVKTVDYGMHYPGYYTETLNVNNLNSGVYFINIRNADSIVTKRLIVQ
ncbi:MAG: T9SS C-terminal target domain-containing protein [Chitinophagaceae bacterium]|nr:MAG: T9SS C-terminal target domain-containing protein [Chitinophagaceae bacterium]